jgi:hypothetical protein
MSAASPPRRVRQRLVEDRAAIQAKIMDSSVIAERNVLRADIMVPPLDNILDIIQTYNWGYLHSCACVVYTRLVKLFYANLEVVQNDDHAVVLSPRYVGPFLVGDQVFLKVSPMKGVMQFGKKGKLSTRYVGPFLVTEVVGPVAYRVELPSNLAGVHDVFHVSTLQKYVHDPLHVIDFEPLQVQADLKYEEKPVQILDRKVQQLRTKTIPLVKVLWQNHEVEEASWELELEIRSKYPYLFP